MTMLEVFNNQSCWTKGTLARDATGNSVPFDSPDACKWCLSGAFCKVYGKHNANIFNSKFMKMVEVVKGRFPGNLNFGLITNFNDDRKTTFNDIVNIVREAGL